MTYKTPILLLLISGALYYRLAPAPPLSDDELSSQIHNKVVLICGASSGIGEELAYQLAGFGAKLVLVARHQDKLDDVRAGVLKLGVSEDNVRTIAFDFSDVKGSGSVINKTIEWFGKLDYLVSNHAVFMRRPFLLFPHDQDPDIVYKVFRVNVLSHIELAVKALPHLEESNGHMFITSSMAGEIPVYYGTIFSSTKFAMNGFFYSLQQELIAKESPVSLTIGAFGFIKTKIKNNIEEVDAKLLNIYIPDFTVGDLTECARGMVQSYITRPTTMTYPKVASYFSRVRWMLTDTNIYHKMVIAYLKPPGGERLEYHDIEKWADRDFE